MTPEEIEALFTRGDGDFLCARWARPIVPAVFGTDDATLRIMKGAIEAMVLHAGHKMAELDTELGANLLIFYFKDWADLEGVPGIDDLVDGLAPVVERMQAEGANQYRLFRFDEDGAIKACISFTQLDNELSILPAEVVALSQATQMILTWSRWAFSALPALMRDDDGEMVLRPELAAVIRAAYDPVLPNASRDGAHALRIAARLKAQRKRGSAKPKAAAKVSTAKKSAMKESAAKKTAAKKPAAKKPSVKKPAVKKAASKKST